MNTDLYLLRHGIAARRGTAWRHDADRPLTKKGAKKIRDVAKAMRDLGLSFDIILSSPLRRAKETADIVARVLRCRKKLRFTDHLKIGGSPEALVHEITTRHRKAGAVLLVGHEPYLSRLISVLVSGTEDLSIRMKKGGLCKLSVQSLRHGRCATLQWLVGPSLVLRSDRIYL